MNTINIYTDGSARGNPGPGGYGVILQYKEHIKELSAGFKLTTNNRMELLAVIVGLESITQKGYEISVFSDSKYVVNAVNQGWLLDWEKTNYKKKKNSDLWKRFLKIYRKHLVKFHWVKGHSGDPKNERCDQLAVVAATGKDLLLDKGYELINKNNKGLFD
tara:strand:+ start:8 stop:490 length:483 start_codon:yes stop_codon:yes gene_type:complete